MIAKVQQMCTNVPFLKIIKFLVYLINTMLNRYGVFY